MKILNMVSKDLEKQFKEIKKEITLELTKKDSDIIKVAPDKQAAIDYYFSEFDEKYQYDRNIGILTTGDHYGHVFYREFLDLIEIFPDFSVAIEKAKEVVKDWYDGIDQDKKQWIYDLSNDEAIRRLAITAAYEYYFHNFRSIHSSDKKCIPEKYYWVPNFNDTATNGIENLFYEIISTHYNLIDSKTSLPQFRKLFTNHNMDKFLPIKWIGTIAELKFFTQQIEKLKFIVKPKKFKYVIAAYLFTHNEYKENPAKQIETNSDISVNQKRKIIKVIEGVIREF